MPFERVNIQLAIKLDEQGRLPAILLTKPTVAQLEAMANMTWAQIFKTMILKYKAYSSRINEGKDNQEETIIAKRHICNHGIPGGQCYEEDI